MRRNPQRLERRRNLWNSRPEAEKFPKIPLSQRDLIPQREEDDEELLADSRCFRGGNIPNISNISIFFFPILAPNPTIPTRVKESWDFYSTNSGLFVVFCFDFFFSGNHGCNIYFLGVEEGLEVLGKKKFKNSQTADFARKPRDGLQISEPVIYK